MKPKLYTVKTWLTFSLGRGEEHEVEVEIEYTFTPGRPATPPSYASGGDPPGPAEANIVSVLIFTLHGPVEAPRWLWDAIEDDNELYWQLVEDGAEQLAEDRAKAAERRAEWENDR